jgi:hypothetical protein
VGGLAPSPLAMKHYPKSIPCSFFIHSQKGIICEEFKGHLLTLMSISSLINPLNVEMNLFHFFWGGAYMKFEVLKNLKLIIAHFNVNNFTTNTTIS